MDVATITMPKDKALEAYRQYREHAKTNQDKAIAIGYKAMAKGRAIINAREAILKAGFDELGRPRLAIAQAHTAEQRWARGYTDGRFRLKPGWELPFPEGVRSDGWRDFRAMVPLIPCHLRPAEKQLRNYWILWEADWLEAPRDPLLLKKLTGDLYVVLAAWDLTDLERAAMGRLGRS